MSSMILIYNNSSFWYLVDWEEFHFVLLVVEEDAGVQWMLGLWNVQFVVLLQALRMK